MLHNLLSSNEITEIVNNPIVEINREKLATLQKVDFSVELSDVIKTKLETGLDIDLSHITSIPMRWIKGDSIPHIDKGDARFHNTYLVYLTDSIGNLFVDGISYPITAGDAHIFSEGIEHYTINTGDSERLLIGPMSETGFHVGVPSTIIYFENETDATTTMNSIGTTYDYTIETVNDISSWIILTNSGGTDPTPNGGPYAAGYTLNATGIYYLYPYVEPTTTTTTTRSFSMKSLFTDNARVYYKPHSLSTGGGGSGVINHRIKQRRT
uniref:Uncharacterized protein n=1 Tax=viral metagenome TaxID=1070528 RepID=A0A6C0HAV9_9ZZZZ